MKKQIDRDKSGEVIKKKKLCKHPKDKREDYHDCSVVCSDCNCVIEQYGKMLSKPSSLSMNY